MAETKAAAQSGSGQSGGKSGGPKKRAVVMIHGMGDQSPMETLRSFVAAVWTTLPPGENQTTRLTWSLRDKASDNLELWRIATNEDAKNVRTDFFEFYWADMMEDTRLSSVLAWFKRLFLRRPRRVPPAVVPPWRFGLVGILVLLLFVVLLAWLVLVTLRLVFVSLCLALLMLVPVAAIVVLFWFLRRRVLVEVVGDAARYLTAAPSNIAARKRIRLAGLTLLEHLHSDPQYDRIIIVAHSLGTVVGYDLINFWWSEVKDDIRHQKSPRSAALARIEAAGQRVLADGGEKALEEFRAAQRAYFAEVRELSAGRWKISDFITLGSPLTHAHFLLVNDGEALLDSERDAIGADWVQKWWKGLDAVTAGVAELFRARATQRELTLCPPITEDPDKITYDPQRGDYVVPHHAAPFAAVRWTNIYARRRWILWGDVVGGPVAPLFGAGVKDIELEGAVAKDFVAHTHYWDVHREDDVHLAALRAAVNLFDDPEEDLWDAYEKACGALKGAAVPSSTPTGTST